METAPHREIQIYTKPYAFSTFQFGSLRSGSGPENLDGVPTVLHVVVLFCFSHLTSGVRRRKHLQGTHLLRGHLLGDAGLLVYLGWVWRHYPARCHFMNKS